MLGDNSLVLRRQQARCATPAMDRQALLDAGKNDGRLRSAVTAAEPPDEKLLLMRDMSRALAQMQRMMSCWMIPSCQTRGFVISSGIAVDVPPEASAGGGQVQIMNLRVDAGFMGMLQGIGFNVEPAPLFEFIQFQLFISGDPYPKFSSNAFRANTLATPIPMPLYVDPEKTLELRAINKGVLPASISAVLHGWMKPAVVGNLSGV